MKQRIYNYCCYFLFALILGIAASLALMWNKESLTARLIYESL